MLHSYVLGVRVHLSLELGLKYICKGLEIFNLWSFFCG